MILNPKIDQAAAKPFHFDRAISFRGEKKSLFTYLTPFRLLIRVLVRGRMKRFLPKKENERIPKDLS